MFLAKFSRNYTSGLKILGLVLAIFAFASVPVSAQIHPNCPLEITGTVGDLANFDVSSLDSQTVSVSIPDVTVGVWGSVMIGTANNANVTISAVPVGTKGPVLITANKVDSNLAANFTVVATDSVGHNVTITTSVNCTVTTHGCTLTQGYWKNHAANWPVNGLTLGTVTYSKTQLISVLNTSVKGNGLIALSYQLIAAKLNIAAGASVPPAVATTIASADALIGGLVAPPVGSGSLSTASTASMTATLDAYNNGLAVDGPPHCDN